MSAYLPRSAFTAALLAAALSPLPAVAGKSHGSCTGVIDSLPAFVKTGEAGTWCLRDDLAISELSGEGIQVTANNIVIDCNGHRIENVLPDNEAEGVLGTGRNLTVRDCDIRGFETGVHSSGEGLLVEDSRFSSLGYTAVQSFGAGSTIRRNHIRGIGDSASNAGIAIGIIAHYGTDVLDNTIDTLTPRPDSVGRAEIRGIWMFGAVGSVIAGNRISGMVPNGPGTIWGIHVDQSDPVYVRDNIVVGIPGRQDTAGIRCGGGETHTGGNILNGFGYRIDSSTYYPHVWGCDSELIEPDIKLL